MTREHMRSIVLRVAGNLRTMASAIPVWYTELLRLADELEAASDWLPDAVTSDSVDPPPPNAPPVTKRPLVCVRCGAPWEPGTKNRCEVEDALAVVGARGAGEEPVTDSRPTNGPSEPVAPAPAPAPERIIVWGVPEPATRSASEGPPTPEPLADVCQRVAFHVESDKHPSDTTVIRRSDAKRLLAVAGDRTRARTLLSLAITLAEGEVATALRETSGPADLYWNGYWAAAHNLAHDIADLAAFKEASR